MSKCSLCKSENILCKHEWNHMSKMHAVAAGPSASIQEEGLPLLVPIQYFVKIAAGYSQLDTF